jgi:hypothetical protein
MKSAAARKTKLAKPAAAPPAPGTRPLVTVMSALAALTVIAYSNSFASGFILDNKALLLDPRIREATADNFALIFQHTYWWPTGEARLYRPLTTLSYLFNYAVLGNRDQPGGYHTVNLLLHVGNVLLAYVLARKFTREFWPPICVAAIWAGHPVTTESVTNIVGRADLLAAMAVLSGFLMYLKSLEAAGGRRAGWIAGLTLATTVGVFSKESAIAILPLIVLWEWMGGFSRTRPLLLGCAATLAPIASMLLARSAVLAHSAAAEFPLYRQSHYWRELVGRAAHRDRRDGSLISAGLLALPAVLRLFLCRNSGCRRYAGGLGCASRAGRHRDPRRSSLSLESDLLLSGGLRTHQLSSRIEPVISDRHHHGRSSFIPAVAWIAGMRGIGYLCR